MCCPDEQRDSDSLPEDAIITPGEAIEILAGHRLPARTTEHNWWGDQLRAAAREGGLVRDATGYFRAEVQALKARLADEGITGPSTERARLVRARNPRAFGLRTTEEQAELEDVGIATMCMRAADPESGAVMIRGRWYFDPEKAPRGRKHARPEQVSVPCSGDECGRPVPVSAAVLRKVQRHYCDRCDPDGTRARREGIAAAREAWDALPADEKHERLSEGNRQAYRDGTRGVNLDAARDALDVKVWSNPTANHARLEKRSRTRWGRGLPQGLVPEILTRSRSRGQLKTARSLDTAKRREKLRELWVDFTKTIPDIAAEMGESESWVKETRRLTKLPPRPRGRRAAK
jgi:hypothetical protein